MKMPAAALALALLVPSLAGAADLALKDGRVLLAARVIRHDAATVTFRHANGFTQVEKSKLPESLAVLYPLDETQVQREAERQARAAQARAAEAQQRQAEQARRAKAEPVPAAPPEPEPASPQAYSPAPSPTPDYAWQQSWDHDHHRRPRHPRFIPPARATPPSWEIQMTPDVRMTPDLHTYNAAASQNPPPEETEEEAPPPSPRPRRAR